MCIRDSIKGTKHTVALHAAQLALFNFNPARQSRTVECNRDDRASKDVVSAGNNLDGISLADVELADDQLVRIRVFLHRKDFADDNVADALALNFIPLDQMCIRDRESTIQLTVSSEPLAKIPLPLTEPVPPIISAVTRIRSPSSGRDAPDAAK